MDVATLPVDRPDAPAVHRRRGRRTIRRAPRRRPFRYTLPGLSGALIFLCASLTPSLLPRSALIQGLISGISAAFGYGVGVLAAYVWRALADRDVRPTRRRSWLLLAGVAAAAYTAAMLPGRYWQARIRHLMDAPADSAVSTVVIPVAAAVVF